MFKFINNSHIIIFSFSLGGIYNVDVIGENYVVNEDTFKFLTSKGANINAINNNNETILFKISSPQVTKYLLDHGALVTIQNNDGNTILHCTSRRNDFLEMLILLANGANLMVKNSKGETPLDVITNPRLKRFIEKIKIIC